MIHLKSFILLLLLIFSCAVIERKSDPLEQFIKTKIAHNQEFIIIKDKVSTRTILRILYGNVNLAADYENSIPVDSGRSKLISAADWKEIYSMHITDTIARTWDRKDFPTLKFKFENQFGLWNNKFLDRHEGHTKSIVWLSEPLFYAKKNFLIFYYAIGTTSVPGADERNVIIMTKKNGKWETAEIIADYVLH